MVVALHRLQAHQRDTHVAGRGTGHEDAGIEGDGGQWRGSGDGDGTAAAVLLSRLVVEAGQASSASENEVGRVDLFAYLLRLLLLLLY